MGLSITRSDWMSIALVSAVATFLSLLMLGYLWYFQQPGFSDLSMQKVVVSNYKKVNWSKGNNRTLQYVELLATPEGLKKQERYVLSSEPEGFRENLVRHYGECVLWFDPRQANEIFQAQIGGTVAVKYQDTYGLKAGGSRSWWRITWFVLAAGSLALFLSFLNLRKPQPQ